MVARVIPPTHWQDVVNASWIMETLKKLESEGVVTPMSQYFHTDRIADEYEEAKRRGFVPKITAHVALAQTRSILKVLQSAGIGHSRDALPTIMVALLLEWEHQQGICNWT